MARAADGARSEGHGRRPLALAQVRHHLAKLGKSFATDLDDGRGFLWWPVAMAIGAALYFAPLNEPSPAVFIAATLVAAGLFALMLIRRRAMLPAVLVLLTALGFLHAAAMTRLTAHPVFPFERTVTLRGHVLAVEDRGKGSARLTLRPLEIEPLPRDGLPPLVRITVRGAVPSPGDAVAALARLAPPMPPPLPGGYDFARVAWFTGIGASGFAYGAVKPWPEAPPAGLGTRAVVAVEGLRVAAAQRIRSALPGDSGAIAAALIVGDRAGISDEANEAMRIAGISHVLSISGVHMSLVAAFLFGGLRLLMALVPPLALNLPIKKIAALASMLGTSLYFIISGMDVPAERSLIMVLVSLTAILIDRRALSLRVISVAALITLTLSPDAVMDPGAQMSFAAVFALMAGLELWLSRESPVPDAGDINPLVRTLRWFGMWVVAALVATTIAGLATLPMALYHFGRLAPLGMLANLVTEPLVSLLIMPAALIAALLLPFGGEWLPLQPMGWGIDGMLAVARIVADWTPGGGLYGRPAGWTMLTVVAGGLWLCLWRGRKRWFGLVPVAAGFALAFTGSPPDLVVAGDGSMALVRDAGGTWHKVGKGGGFTLDVWTQALGIDMATVPPLDRDTGCDDEACFLPVAEGRPSVSVVVSPMAFGDDCALADILVAARAAPPWCRPALIRLDGAALKETGTLLFDIDRSNDGATQLKERGRVQGEPRRLWLSAGRD